MICQRYTVVSLCVSVTLISRRMLITLCYICAAGLCVCMVAVYLYVYLKYMCGRHQRYRPFVKMLLKWFSTSSELYRVKCTNVLDASVLVQKSTESAQTCNINAAWNFWYWSDLMIILMYSSCRQISSVQVCRFMYKVLKLSNLKLLIEVLFWNCIIEVIYCTPVIIVLQTNPSTNPYISYTLHIIATCSYPYSLYSIIYVIHNNTIMV